MHWGRKKIRNFALGRSLGGVLKRTYLPIFQGCIGQVLVLIQPDIRLIRVTEIHFRLFCYFSSPKSGKQFFIFDRSTKSCSVLRITHLQYLILQLFFTRTKFVAYVKKAQLHIWPYIWHLRYPVCDIRYRYGGIRPNARYSGLSGRIKDIQCIPIICD